MFQSTRPRGARLHFLMTQPMMFVSIHAPTGGATKDRLRKAGYKSFNPRAHGGRDLLIYGIIYAMRFQSTRPRGARRAGPLKFTTIFVSIHAPTGGAT